MKNNIELAFPVVNINIINDQWSENISNLVDKILTAINRTLEEVDFDKNIELSIRLTSDKEMKELNNQFRGKPDVTNVLSFPQDVKGALFFDDPSYMGDIALGFEVINEESYQQKKSLSAHLIHLIIHGLLHLIGYDHKNDVESKTMEDLEINILKCLGYKNPYYTKLID